MQIDELPAGEQTQNPDLDMNQVVGTHDILMLCFDTLRYDVSKEEEEAGRTRYAAVSGCFSLCKLVRDVFRLREVIRLRKQLLCKALPM